MANADPEQARKRALRRRKRQRRIARGQVRSKTWCRVYALTDPSGRIRYVGQTRLELKARMKWLRRAAVNGNSPVERWMRAEEAEIILLDDNGTWDVSEIIWIERLRAKGEPLLNVLRGGRDTLDAVRRD